MKRNGGLCPYENKRIKEHYGIPIHRSPSLCLSDRMKNVKTRSNPRLRSGYLAVVPRHRRALPLEATTSAVRHRLRFAKQVRNVCSASFDAQRIQNAP